MHFRMELILYGKQRHRTIIIRWMILQFGLQRIIQTHHRHGVKLLDDEFEAKLKIIKQDDETKKPVLQKKYRVQDLYDLDNKKYVEQVTTYPTTVKHKSYFTDEQGYLILPQNLKIGKYRIEEVKAPFGYTLNENYYEVTVDSNTAYQMEGTSGMHHRRDL